MFKALHGLGKKIGNALLNQNPITKAAMFNYDRCDCIIKLLNYLDHITYIDKDQEDELKAFNEQLVGYKIEDEDEYDIHIKSFIETIEAIRAEESELATYGPVDNLHIQQIEQFQKSTRELLSKAQKIFHQGMASVFTPIGFHEPEDTYNNYRLIKAKLFIHSKIEELPENDNDAFEELLDKYFPKTNLIDAEFASTQTDKSTLNTIANPVSPGVQAEAHTSGTPLRYAEAEQIDIAHASQPALETTTQTPEILKNNLGHHVKLNLEEIEKHMLLEQSDTNIDILTCFVCSLNAFKKVDERHLNEYTNILMEGSSNQTITAILTALGIGEDNNDERTLEFISKQFSVFMSSRQQHNHARGGLNLTDIASQVAQQIKHIEDIAPTDITSNLHATSLAALSFLVKNNYMSLDNAKTFAIFATGEVGKSRDILSLVVLLASLIGQGVAADTLKTNLDRRLPINTEQDTNKRIAYIIDLALEICGIGSPDIRVFHANNFTNLIAESNRQGNEPRELDTQRLILSSFAWLEAITHPKTQSLMLVGIFLTMYCMAHVSLTLLGIQFTAVQVASVIGINVAILGIGATFLTMSLKSISLKEYDTRNTTHGQLSANSMVHRVQKVGIWESFRSMWRSSTNEAESVGDTPVIPNQTPRSSDNGSTREGIEASNQNPHDTNIIAAGEGVETPATEGYTSGTLNTTPEALSNRSTAHESTTQGT